MTADQGHDVPPAPRWDGRTPRGPATEAEALAMVQRSFAEGLNRRRGEGVGAPVRWPDAVPTVRGGRQMAAWRLDPEALAYARARASLEDLTLSEVLDRLLRQFAAAPPGSWPVGWDRPDGEVDLDPDLPGR